MKKEGYDMFNINDPFYQDICTPFDSPNGTDILLIDRINYIYNNDDTQCQSNCFFSNYYVESEYIQCSCSTDLNIKNDNLIEDKFCAKKIYESFYDVLRYSNYKILKCYKIITNISVIKSNIGSIIALIFFFCYLICLFIYLISGINPLKKKIRKQFNKVKLKKSISKIKSDIYKLLYPPIKKNSISKLSHKSIKRNNNKILFNNINISSKRGTNKELKIYSNSGSRNIVLENQKLNKLSINNEKSKYKKEGENTKKINYSDYELNELKYKKALKLDKRTLFQIYWAALKREHLIFFTFCSCDDYNLLSIKISRLAFLIVGDMALNTFFFSDDSMHKLFLDYGKYDFIQQIPQITYSTVISLLIETFLCFLSLTDKYVYLIKSSYIKGDKNEIKKIIKSIKIKLMFFVEFIEILK